MIEFKNVSKRYDNTPAVNDCSFSIPSHKFCVLIGPSGCGKTTMLRTVNRLVIPNEGAVLIDDTNVADIPVTKLRKKIGYVIQTIGLFPHMTVEKNISVVPKLLKWEKNRISKRVDEMLDLVGLEPKQYKKKRTSELSGGEAQRIGVARALASDPPILLMDEPFGAVDPINREILQQSFLKIQRELKKTILFVTHDMNEALKMADIIAIMKNGELIQFNSPLEILSKPENEFVKSFFGTDRIMKRLSMLKAKDYLQEEPENSPKDQPKITITKDFSLKDALSILFEKNVDSAQFITEKETGFLSMPVIREASGDGYVE
jgi:osmoprotectant transport system ATP-binding protein